MSDKEVSRRQLLEDAAFVAGGAGILALSGWVLKDAIDLNNRSQRQTNDAGRLQAEGQAALRQGNENLGRRDLSRAGQLRKQAGLDSTASGGNGASALEVFAAGVVVAGLGIHEWRKDWAQRQCERQPERSGVMTRAREVFRSRSRRGSQR